MREGSLSVRNEVLFLNEFQAPQTSYENKELDVWKALLSEEKPEELLERLQKYLDRTEREGMITREFLVALRTDLTQVVYAWLSEREIKAYALFADADMENLHRNSLYGREEMMEYAGVLVRKAVQYRQYINKSDSVTSQVCAYIDAHYREEIHREELGELVFLNTDYLSRIFKKEKGISISNYIIQKRVEEAKKLLTQSSLPINTVSLYVGYSNFSYFTKMFKDNTGRWNTEEALVKNSGKPPFTCPGNNRGFYHFLTHRNNSKQVRIVKEKGRIRGYFFQIRCGKISV